MKNRLLQSVNYNRIFCSMELMEKMNYDIKEQLDRLKTELSHINEDDFSGFIALYDRARDLIRHFCHHPIIKEALGSEQFHWFQNNREEYLKINPKQYRTDIGFSLALCEHILDEEGLR